MDNAVTIPDLINLVKQARGLKGVARTAALKWVRPLWKVLDKTPADLIEKTYNNLVGLDGLIKAGLVYDPFGTVDLGIKLVAKGKYCEYLIIRVNGTRTMKITYCDPTDGQATIWGPTDSDVQAKGKGWKGLKSAFFGTPAPAPKNPKTETVKIDIPWIDALSGDIPDFTGKDRVEFIPNYANVKVR